MFSVISRLITTHVRQNIVKESTVLKLKAQNIKAGTFLELLNAD